MKRHHLDFTAWKRNALKNPHLKAEYDKLRPEFAVIRAVIEARIKRGLTQVDLARKVGTKQSVISRLESGKANPLTAFLKKLARALNANLEVKLVYK